jgi:hypothetical protein
VARLKITLDPAELKEAGIEPDAPVPLDLTASLTLRGWLNLCLSPFGLTYVASDDGLKVVRRTGTNDALARPSDRQRAANERVEGVLRKPIRFSFQDTPLKDVLANLEKQAQETFLLDPAGRRDGALKLDSKVTGAGDGPLNEALTRLLEPLGMTYVVREEAVVITKKP